MPLPFTRELRNGMSGKDVIIAQNFLARTPMVSLQVTGAFDSATENAVYAFQNTYSLPQTGVIDDATAAALLDNNAYGMLETRFLLIPLLVMKLSRFFNTNRRRIVSLTDGYKDPLVFPLPKQYLYKVYIPVHQDRSIETNATLFSQNGTVLLRFVVRCHGQNDANGVQYNMFSPNGVTPTGLTEFDLNSPETDPIPYGPYPVNRAVKGLVGNSVCRTRTTRFAPAS